jgi:cell division control protein 6
VQNTTPETPRHRDALSKEPPITPRHRVTFTGKALTPRTPRTPGTPGGALTTVYSQARQLFSRSAEPGQLIGRDFERHELTEFVRTCITKVSGGCIYVSGPPGTGKSAIVREVADTFEISLTLRKLYINCMSIKTSRDLCGKLLETMGEELDVLEGDEVKALQGIFLPKRKTNTVYIITLDEIDHILTLDLEILYKLFEWSLQKSSHLVLVGIANALDLTGRFLPRLKARNLKPQLLPFLPYTASQIKTVITTRLKSLMPADSATPAYVPFLHPAAIELCSRKVSSQTGDLRKAFDICRRAIDLIEVETKQKHEQALNEQALHESPSKRPLEENVNFSSPAGLANKKMKNLSLAQSLATLTVETAPRASICHVNKITSATFGNGSSQRLKTLNLQQKAALCALVTLEKRKREAVVNVMATPSKSRHAAPTVKALYDVYCMLCKRDSILHPLTSTEFRDVIGSLETLSLISAVDGKNGSFVGLNTPSKRGRKFGSGVGVGDEKRVGSCVGEKEVAQAVEGLGAGILMSILSGEGLD